MQGRRYKGVNNTITANYTSFFSLLLLGGLCFGTFPSFAVSVITWPPIGGGKRCGHTACAATEAGRFTCPLSNVGRERGVKKKNNNNHKKDVRFQKLAVNTEKCSLIAAGGDDLLSPSWTKSSDLLPASASGAAADAHHK